MVKVNPIAAWTQDDVDAYIAEHQVPVNPLFELGYGSIGCAPCTRPVAAGRGPARRPLGRQRQDRVRHPHLKGPRPPTLRTLRPSLVTGPAGPWGHAPSAAPVPRRARPPRCPGCRCGPGTATACTAPSSCPPSGTPSPRSCAIADVAEEMDHHPDIDLRWRTLHLTLVSHSAGGVTELDLELARRIDALLPVRRPHHVPPAPGSRQKRSTR